MKKYKTSAYYPYGESPSVFLASMIGYIAYSDTNSFLCTNQIVGTSRLKVYQFLYLHISNW